MLLACIIIYKRKFFNKWSFQLDAWAEKYPLFSELVLILFYFTYLASIYRLFIFDIPPNHAHWNAIYQSLYNFIQNPQEIKNTYGFYPFFFYFFVSKAHLTTHNISSIFSLISALTLVPFIWGLHRHLNNFKWALIASGGLFFNFLRTKLVSNDAYFQYSPLRTLFPSLMIFFTLLINSKTLKRYKWIISLIATPIMTLGLFWNFESGLLALLSWIAVIFYLELRARRNILKIFSELFFHILLIFMTFEGIKFSTESFFGFTPPFENLYSTLKMFSHYGYLMIPMPRLHLWLVYALLLLFFLNKIVMNLINRVDDFDVSFYLPIFFVSLGGLAYFLGRSHYDTFFNLLPYFVTMLILFFKWLKDFLVKNSMNSEAKWTEILFIFIFIFPNIYGVYKISLGHYHGSLLRADPIDSTAIEFIKKYVKPNEEVVFWSPSYSGIFHELTGTVGPSSITGPIDLFYKSDLQASKQSIHLRKSKVFCFQEFECLVKNDSQYKLTEKYKNEVFIYQYID